MENENTLYYLYEKHVEISVKFTDSVSLPDETITIDICKLHEYIFVKFTNNMVIVGTTKNDDESRIFKVYSSRNVANISFGYGNEEE